jgi:chemotaxis-related protein WspB
MLALLFQVGPNRIAVDVRRVREVVPRVRLTPSSDQSEWSAGVFVYRGQVVSVIDLHRLAGLGDCPEHLSSRIILVPQGAPQGTLVGLLATQVADVRELTIPPGVATSSSILGDPIADGTGVLRVFDPDRLFARLAGETA